MEDNLIYKLEKWLSPAKAKRISIFYVGFIYATLPVMRPVVNFLKANLKDSFSFGVYLFLFCVSLGLIFVFLKYKKRKSSLFALLGILGASAYLVTKIKYPEERIHFLEYAILGILLYFAMREKIKGKSIFFFISFFVFLIGFGDEIIQGLLPNRVYDPRDVIMNFIGGVIGELILIVFQR